MRNAPDLRWRVLRSEHDFATTADAPPGSDQTVVLEGADTYLLDGKVVEGSPYFYGVFSQEGDGVWQLQVQTRLAHLDRLRWLHPSRKDWPEPEHDAAAGTPFVMAGTLHDHLGVGGVLMMSHVPLI